MKNEISGIEEPLVNETGIKSLSMDQWRVLQYIKRFSMTTAKDIAIGVFRNKNKWMITSYCVSILLDRGWILSDNVAGKLPKFYFNTTREQELKDFPRPIAPPKFRK